MTSTSWLRAGAVGLSVLAAASLSGRAIAQETIELRGVTPYTAENYLAQPLFIFGEMLKEKTGGRVVVKYLGAEEIIPALEQFDAVRNGAVDIALGVASYYTGTVPEAIGIQYNRTKLPEQLRKEGFNDLMEKVHLEKGGVVYIANASGTPGSAFRLYTSKAITSTADMKGMKFRVSPVYTAIVQAMEATPVSMPPADTYAALERGIVDGLGWTYGGTLDYGFPEVAKYVINHPFYSLNSTILMNEGAFNRLPDDLQQTVRELGAEFEKRVVEYYADYVSKEDEKLTAAGAQFIDFPQEDAERYISAAYDAGWAAFLRDNPENGQKIKDMLAD
jgi:TRAP-type C4-dicarboxylate transport system substrate-binding protein